MLSIKKVKFKSHTPFHGWVEYTLDFGQGFPELLDIVGEHRYVLPGAQLRLGR